MVGADRWLNRFCFYLIDTDLQDQRPATEEKKEYKGDGESKAASDETQSKRQAGGKSNLQGDRDTTDAGKTEKEPGTSVHHSPLLV